MEGKKGRELCLSCGGRKGWGGGGGGGDEEGRTSNHTLYTPPTLDGFSHYRPRMNTVIKNVIMCARGITAHHFLCVEVCDWVLGSLCLSSPFLPLHVVGGVVVEGRRRERKVKKCLQWSA